MEEDFAGWDADGGELRAAFGAFISRYLRVRWRQAPASHGRRWGILAEMEVVGTTRHACGTPVAGVGRVGP